MGRLTGFEPVLALPQSAVRNQYTIAAMSFCVCPRLESNQHLDLRRILFYPLNYEGLFKILSQKTAFDKKGFFVYYNLVGVLQYRPGYGVTVARIVWDDLVSVQI